LGAVPGTAISMLQMAVPARFLSPSMYTRTIGSIAGGRARHDKEWVEKLAATRLRHTSMRGYIGQVVSLSRWSGLPLLQKIPHPTLVVTGDDDPLAPVANAMLLVRLLPQARMLLAPGESHLLLVDCESPVLEPIRQFLAAEPHDDAQAWQDAVLVTDDELRAAIPPLTSQAQPWGAVGALLRRRWLSLNTA
jgi:pimeloyl-ACP methyl ester carboxylesterase